MHHDFVLPLVMPGCLCRHPWYITEPKNLFAKPLLEPDLKLLMFKSGVFSISWHRVGARFELSLIVCCVECKTRHFHRIWMICFFMATERTRGVYSNTLYFFDPDQVGGIATKVLGSWMVSFSYIFERGVKRVDRSLMSGASRTVEIGYAFSDRHDVPSWG